jgi:8-oxo-dGTP pyrophosphatase MutT (NUDIX family)
MTESKIVAELKTIIEGKFSNTEIAQEFLKRLKQGELTRDENQKSHFCAYFAAYDPKAKQVFVGHHKKSGLWLFNGGHIDKEENTKETVVREIGEEWGLNGDNFEIKAPALLTITEINNPTKQPCNSHYDLWFFIAVDKKSFNPVEANLLEEFHKTGWKNLSEARHLITEKNTLSAIDFIEKNYFKKQ